MSGATQVGSVSPGGVRVEHVVTSGTFSLDGGTWDVDNNVWVVGDDRECVVIDAPHDAAPILEAVGDRRLTAILCTHSHDDHVTAVGDLIDATGATAYLHPADRMLWDRVHSFAPGAELADGDVVSVGDVKLHVLHTPGHSPGGCSFHAPALGVVFTGDTLFQGGPDETLAHSGHGDSTTIGAEKPHLQEWIDRGH